MKQSDIYVILFTIIILSSFVIVHEGVHYIQANLDERIIFERFDMFPNCGSGIFCIITEFNAELEDEEIRNIIFRMEVIATIISLTISVVSAIFLKRLGVKKKWL